MVRGSSRPALITVVIALIFACFASASAKAQTGVTMVEEYIDSEPPNGGDPCGEHHFLPTQSMDSGCECELSHSSLEPDHPADPNDTADPVYLHNGMVSYRATDMFIPGRGMPFEIKRRYNSKRANVSGWIHAGNGWTLNYDIVLDVQSSKATLYQGDGTRREWQWQSSAWVTPEGVYSSLKTVISSLVYQIRSADGTKTTFTALASPSGHILCPVSRIEDRNGNALTFTYTTMGIPAGIYWHLTTVTDTLGRAITFGYDSTTHELTSIQDFFGSPGRTVLYDYDTNGTLTSVRSPTIGTTSGFNDFTSGRTEGYEYEGARPHRLTTIRHPEQYPSGTPAAEFTYYDNTSWREGYCESQTRGSDTILYAYDLDDTTTAISSSSVGISRLKTSVTDRRGNQTDYFFDDRANLIQKDEIVTLPTTHPVTTLYEYNIDGKRTKTTYPRLNVELRTYQTGGSRWTEGNLTSITWKESSSASTSRSVSFTWEPVFNRISTYTDERGGVTTFVYDYQEGQITSSLAAEYAWTAITSELGGYTPSFSGAFFHDTDMNGDGQHMVLHGNLIQRIDPQVTLSTLGGVDGQSKYPTPGGSTVQDATTSYTYNSFGQRTTKTDAEENVTVYLYNTERDPDGDTNNLIMTLDPDTGGYLKSVIADVDRTAISSIDAQLTGVSQRSLGTDIGRESGLDPTETSRRTDIVYDRVGNITAVYDARGVKTSFAVNELNEVWKVTRASSVSRVSSRSGGVDGATESLTGQNFSYVEKTKYDANGKVIQRLVQNSGNLSDAGNVSGYIETDLEYDDFDRLVTLTQEGDYTNGASVTTFVYDENDNLIERHDPESQETDFEYDERDQLINVVRQGSSSTNDPIQFGYDENGNRILVQRPEGGQTNIDFDFYDRAHVVTDPAGTVTTYTYDEASNVTLILRQGYDHPGGSFVNLAQSEYAYDERQRLMQVDVSAPSGQTALVDENLTPSDGKVTTRFDYDRLGRRTFKVLDNVAQVFETRYDGGSRPIQTLDPEGNSVAYHYDDNGNLVKQVETEHYPSSTGISDRDFETFNVYDSLDRLTASMDNAYQTRRFSYDSRGNLIEVTDAKGTTSGGPTINGHTTNVAGNSHRYFHDGLSRIVGEEIDLNTGGTSGGSLIHTIAISQTWDKSSRLVGKIDDNGNLTEWGYDGVNRVMSQTFADTTQQHYFYDGDDNIIGVVDARGDTVALTYDAADRLTDVDAVLGTGVVGTTALRFEYDGLNRRTKTRDSVDGALDSNDWIVERTYDAASNLVEEIQGGRTVQMSYLGGSKRSSLTYPSGTVINYAYDNLSRIKEIADGSTVLASYDFAGAAGRLMKRQIKISSTKQLDEFHWDSGGEFYDAARRPTKMETKNRVGTTVSGFEYGYDREGSRLFEKRLDGSGIGDNYEVDSIGRVVQFERDASIAANHVDGTIDPTNHAPQVHKQWTIDGVQNWTQLVTTDLGVSPVTTNTTTNTVNEYTAFGSESPTHDADGNMTSPNSGAGSPITLKYDFLNRLREIDQGTSYVKHDYDAEGRRVRTTTSGVSSAPAFTEYVYDAWEVIEEWDSSPGLMRRFVMGQKIDEPLRLENLSGYSNGGTYYYQRSSIGNIVALTNANGGTVERYKFDAYGTPRFEDASNVAKSVVESEFGNPYLFTGRRYEPWIVGFYEFRSRMYSPSQGRFLQRDPIGAWGDNINLGNPMAYVGGHVLTHYDPYGLDASAAAAGSGVFESLLSKGGALLDAGTSLLSEGAAAAGEFFTGLATAAVAEVEVAVAAVFTPEVVVAAVLTVTVIGGLVFYVIPNAVENQMRRLYTEGRLEGEGPAAPPDTPPVAKPHTPDQRALNELAKGLKRSGMDAGTAEIVRRWCDELGREFRGPEKHPDRPNPASKKPHYHVDNVDHIPAK